MKIPQQIRRTIIKIKMKIRRRIKLKMKIPQNNHVNKQI